MFSKEYLEEGIIEKYKQNYRKGQLEAIKGTIEGLRSNQKACKDKKCKEKYQKEIDDAKEALINVKKKHMMYPIGGYSLTRKLIRTVK